MIRTAIVDDADDLRMLVRLQLELDGRFEVVGEAGDGVDALSLIDSQDPDLVVLDLAMPLMDGLEVLRELQNRHWQRPVVVFSGFGSSTMVDRALALGASSYVTKGADLHGLPQLLADTVAGIQ